MTNPVSAFLKKGVQFLESFGVPEAKISAEELLSFVLRKPRFSLYLEPEITVEDRFVSEFEKLLRKRADRYPLQYLLRTVSFRNVSLEVGEGCLIPRPETEILVEAVIRKLGNEKKLDLLDIGTGSGNIAISLANERPLWTITATDISEEALYYAKKNADRNNVSDRTYFFEADIYERLEEARFDVVISNPPYLTGKELTELQPELIFEPSVALDGGEDGLQFFGRIALAAKKLLRKNGFIFFEVGLGQAKSVIRILEENGFRSLEILKDNAGIERIVSGVLF